MIDVLTAQRARIGRLAVLVLAFATLVAGAQSLLFFNEFVPRVTRANAQLFDLMVENSQRTLYRRIAAQIDTLRDWVPEANPGERTLADAWDDFQNHFSAAPQEAIGTLIGELPDLTATIGGDAGQVGLLAANLERLQAMYADSYKDLLADLRRPAAYLRPTAASIARRSGYLQAVTLNRALYLAQTGDIGTARVILAGLSASSDDPEVLGTIYYTLGRLQLELFLASPEAEYFTQAVQYLGRSLVANPDMQLARHLLDYLLSLSQAATAPQSAEGRPETPSEGEGAAVSAENRVF